MTGFLANFWICYILGGGGDVPHYTIEHELQIVSEVADRLYFTTLVGSDLKNTTGILKRLEIVSAEVGS